MSEIVGVTKVDSTVAYNTVKKSSDASGDFSSYLETPKKLEDIFEQASDQYKVPVELLKAVGKAESNFNANAVSRCGAQGVMQLMPSTAKGLGVTDSFDAEQNIMGGAKYISALLKKYDGNVKLTLAAYNAGSGNVSKYGGVPPFEETRNYVKKIMNYLGGNIEIAASDHTVSGTAAAGQTVMSAPVQKNLSFLPTNDIDSTASSLQDLENSFSYDDYMKFIELFMQDKEEEDTEEDKPVYSSGEINYNIPVLNLLKGQINP